jgi:hypothetical protein
LNAAPSARSGDTTPLRDLDRGGWSGCNPERGTWSARIAADTPGSTIIVCGPDLATVQRGDHAIELETAGGDIVGGPATRRA